MAKMTIIEVNLGQDIDTIISEDVEEMTGQLKQVIDEAIEEKRTVETERTKKAEERVQKSQQTLNVLEKIYQALLAASEQDSVIEIDNLVEMASPIITNASALVLQLKSYIRKHKGNEYVLTRKTRNRKSVYLLAPFNAE